MGSWMDQCQRCQGSRCCQLGQNDSFDKPCPLEQEGSAKNSEKLNQLSERENQAHLFEGQAQVVDEIYVREGREGSGDEGPDRHSRQKPAQERIRQAWELHVWRCSRQVQPEQGKDRKSRCPTGKLEREPAGLVRSQRVRKVPQPARQLAGNQGAEGGDTNARGEHEAEREWTFPLSSEAGDGRREADGPGTKGHPGQQRED